METSVYRHYLYRLRLSSSSRFWFKHYKKKVKIFVVTIIQMISEFIIYDERIGAS